MTSTQADAGFTITWDHDFVYLWCERCTDDSEEPVGFFCGNPTDVTDINTAIAEHRNCRNPEKEPTS